MFRHESDPFMGIRSETLTDSEAGRITHEYIQNALHIIPAMFPGQIEILRPNAIPVNAVRGSDTFRIDYRRHKIPRAIEGGKFTEILVVDLNPTSDGSPHDFVYLRSDFNQGNDNWLEFTNGDFIVLRKGRTLPPTRSGIEKVRGVLDDMLRPGDSYSEIFGL